MFTLVTGTPGAGKTLSVVDQYRHIKDRPIFYSNIDGLSDSLGWTRIDDVRNYHEHLPQNSIFIIDEAQQFFPVRAPKDNVPPAVSHLETHRHEGQDIVWITQHPSLIDHHARRLAGEHIHYQRNFGLKFSTKYRGNQVFDPKNYHELKVCEKTQYKHPKEVFALYKSAEAHTHKARLPKKLLLLPLLLLVVGGLFYSAYTTLHKHDAPVVESIAQTAGIKTETKEEKKRDLIADLKPEIDGVPWSAPFYKDLAKPKELPLVAGCVASADRCSCYTQQATLVSMSDTLCRSYLRHNPFNPFGNQKETKEL